MSWPTELAGNQIYNSPVTSLDLMSTFTAAAGDIATTEDSVNLLPYLKGEKSGAPHEYLYWRAGPTQAIRNSQWKLIKYKLTELTGAELDSFGRLIPPAGGFTTEAPLGLKTLLYDMQNDPGETQNVADQFPDVVEQLEQEYSRWNAQLPPPEQTILPASRSIITEVDGDSFQRIF